MLRREMPNAIHALGLHIGGQRYRAPSDKIDVVVHNANGLYTHENHLGAAAVPQALASALKYACRTRSPTAELASAAIGITALAARGLSTCTVTAARPSCARRRVSFDETRHVGRRDLRAIFSDVFATLILILSHFCRVFVSANVFGPDVRRGL